MDKLFVVVIECMVKYLLYGKFICCIIKLYVYDENNEVKLGDVVEIKECCFVLKIKVYILVCVVEKVVV